LVEVRLWSEVAEGLVRAVGIVDRLPFAERAVDLGQGSWELHDLIELFAVGAVGALDVTVELGRARRKDEELDATVAASILELRHEL
jgi:hypothetical protein